MGAIQGRNDAGRVGYVGPKPPIGDPAHTYHVQIFALNASLGLKPGASREQVIEAMQGKVLAVGETVGSFQAEATVNAATEPQPKPAETLK